MKNFLYNNKKKVAFTIVIVLIIAICILKTIDILQANKYGHFERISNMNVARAGHKSFLLSDGKVLIVGGNNYYINNAKFIYPQKKENNSIEIYNPRTKTFIFNRDLGEYIKPQSSITLLKNDKLLITGGEIVSNNHNGLKVKNYSSAIIYDPKSNHISTLPNMHTPRGSHLSILLNDGRVLISGGDKLNSSEIFDPKINNFILLKSHINYKHGANTLFCILKNNQVLLLNPTLETKQEAEYFNAKTNSFAVISSPLYPTMNLKNFNLKKYSFEHIVPLNGDKIVMFGNYNDQFNNTSIYNTISKKNQNIGSMKIKGRHNYEVTLLKNNNILITDGYIGKADLTFLLDTNEIFDTQNLHFYKLRRLNDRRYLSSTILLKNGDVLVTGGKSYNSKYQKSAILYKFPKTK